MNDDLLVSRFERKGKLREIFASTLKKIDNDKTLASDTEIAKEAAIFYDVNDRPRYNSENHKTKISVTSERTLEAAQRLLKKSGTKVAVLNFANSVTPGGGVRGGSGAQEESLCRCSNLYPIIEQDRFLEAYYDKNRAENDFRATNAIIYAPNVTVLKTDTDYPKLMPKKEWYKVDVITCAAPCLYGQRSYYDKIAEKEVVIDSNWQTKIHLSRCKQILRTALANNARRLVLGAFGCGAFGNNPKSVARGMQLALKEFDSQFEEIVFAIYHQPYELRNYQVFKRVFEGKVDYDLRRFLVAQDEHYDRALAEIKAGQKQTHWMWFIFPQLKGLGFSMMSDYYGISDLDEARAYLGNAKLKKNLIEISTALNECDGEIVDIMGNPDYRKLLSCMTLFSIADPSIEIFQKIIDKFYLGVKDKKTLNLLAE